MRYAGYVRRLQIRGPTPSTTLPVRIFFFSPKNGIELISFFNQIARQDWGWKPEYTFEAMIEDMLSKLSDKLGVLVKNE